MPDNYLLPFIRLIVCQTVRGKQGITVQETDQHPEEKKSLPSAASRQVVYSLKKARVKERLYPQVAPHQSYGEANFPKNHCGHQIRRGHNVGH